MQRMYLQIQPVTIQFSLWFTQPENASSETRTALLSLKDCLCSLSCVCVHSRTCISLLLPRTSWLSSNNYLLDTAPGISLLIVQLCRSGMATEPRHCKQKYLSWNHMQHRFWCGTEKNNITSKVNALTIEQHALQGWHFFCIEATDKLTVNKCCKPHTAKAVCLHASRITNMRRGKNK